MVEQLALDLSRPAPPTPPADAFDVFVAPTAGRPDPSGPLPLVAVGIREAEQCAGAIAGVDPARCLAIPARHWSDELIALLDQENREADASIRRLGELHARILGYSVDELASLLAAGESERNGSREAAKAQRPRAVKPSEIGKRVLTERQRELLALVRVDDNFAVYTPDERIPDWNELKSTMLALGGSWAKASKRRSDRELPKHAIAALRYVLSELEKEFPGAG